MLAWYLALGLLGADTCEPDAAGRAQLLDRARAIEANNADLSEIWPGYWIDNQPFIIQVPSCGAVFGGAASPGSEPLVEDADLTSSGSGFVLDHPSGPADTIFVELDAPGDNLSLLFHEQFHDFQKDAFVGTGQGAGEFVDIDTIADLESFTVDVFHERTLLDRAVSTTDTAERQRYARWYVEARQRRLMPLATEIREIEDYRERSEGTAEYAAMHALVVMDPAGPSLAARISAALNHPLLGSSGSYVTSVFRSRAYGVGAAQAWLLDALAVPRWRERVEQGEGLAGLLEEAVAQQPAPVGLLPPPVDPQMAQTVRAQMSALAAAPVDIGAVLASRPAWIKVILDVASGKSAQMEMSFHAAKMTPLPDDVLALDQVTGFTAALEAFKLEVRGRAVLLQTPQNVDRFVFWVAADEVGELAAVQGQKTDTPIEIDTPSLSLRLPMGAEVRKDGDIVEIRASL